MKLKNAIVSAALVVALIPLSLTASAQNLYFEWNIEKIIEEHSKQQNFTHTKWEDITIELKKGEEKKFFLWELFNINGRKLSLTYEEDNILKYFFDTNSLEMNIFDNNPAGKNTFHIEMCMETKNQLSLQNATNWTLKTYFFERSAVE